MSCEGWGMSREGWGMSREGWGAGAKQQQEAGRPRLRRADVGLEPLAGELSQRVGNGRIGRGQQRGAQRVAADIAAPALVGDLARLAGVVVERDALVPRRARARTAHEQAVGGRQTAVQQGIARPVRLQVDDPVRVRRQVLDDAVAVADAPRAHARDRHVRVGRMPEDAVEDADDPGSLDGMPVQDDLAGRGVVAAEGVAEQAPRVVAAFRIERRADGRDALRARRGRHAVAVERAAADRRDVAGVDDRAGHQRDAALRLRLRAVNDVRDERAGIDDMVVSPRVQDARRGAREVPAVSDDPVGQKQAVAHDRGLVVRQDDDGARVRRDEVLDEPRAANPHRRGVVSEDDAQAAVADRADVVVPLEGAALDVQRDVRRVDAESALVVGDLVPHGDIAQGDDMVLCLYGLIRADGRAVAPVEGAVLDRERRAPPDDAPVVEAPEEAAVADRGGDLAELEARRREDEAVHDHGLARRRLARRVEGVDAVAGRPEQLLVRRIGRIERSVVVHHAHLLPVPQDVRARAVAPDGRPISADDRRVRRDVASGDSLVRRGVGESAVEGRARRDGKPVRRVDALGDVDRARDVLPGLRDGRREVSRVVPARARAGRPWLDVEDRPRQQRRGRERE